jgi:hypothetical protein
MNYYTNVFFDNKKFQQLELVIKILKNVNF